MQNTLGYVHGIVIYICYVIYVQQVRPLVHASCVGL